jgi:N-acetylglucosamine kinase-like BadF-type ATPase
MTRKHYVAIDGGNSKTHVVVGDSDGRLLAFVRGPGSSPHFLTVNGTIALLSSLVGAAVAKAGLAAGTAPDRVELYIAGADLPVEVDVLMKAVGEASWAREHRVDNDLFALLRAGTSDPDAVAVVCGAGINCVGRSADGRTARFPALGDITGDWGGGQALARLALWYAARGEDGRGAPTALTAAVSDHFGRSTVEEVATGLHLGALDKERIDELSPVLFEIAAAGDPVARKVVVRQAREVVALATVAARRLDLLDRPHTVVLGGGVLTARHALLHESIVDGLLAVAPGASITIVEDPPVAGAALLALDMLAPPDATVESAVRDAIREAAAQDRVAPVLSTVDDE